MRTLPCGDLVALVTIMIIGSLSAPPSIHPLQNLMASASAFNFSARATSVNGKRSSVVSALLKADASGSASDPINGTFRSPAGSDVGPSIVTMR